MMGGLSMVRPIAFPSIPLTDTVPDIVYRLRYRVRYFFMAAKNRILPSGTAYKIYVANKGVPSDTNTVSSIESILAELEKVSPLVVYKTFDISQMTGKAEVTVNKAARQLNLGYRCGTARCYRSTEVKQIVKHFHSLDTQKKAVGRRMDREVFRDWWAFNEIEAIKDRQRQVLEHAKKLEQELARCYALLEDIFNGMQTWRSKMDVAVSALDKRIREIEKKSG